VGGGHGYFAVVQGDEAVVTACIGAKRGPKAQGGKPAYKEVQTGVLAAEDDGGLRGILGYLKNRRDRSGDSGGCTISGISGGLFPLWAERRGGLFPGKEGPRPAGPEVAVNILLGDPYLLSHSGGGKLPPLDEFIDSIFLDP
jgi:hypothetical protein